MKTGLSIWLCGRASSDEVGENGGPAVIVAPLGDPITPADEIRACCRSVVLMQRACDGILRQCGTVMPASAQLHLLSILQVCAFRASLAIKDQLELARSDLSRSHLDKSSTVNRAVHLVTLHAQDAILQRTV